MTDTRVRAPSPPTTVTEAVSTGTAQPQAGGRMLIQIITPGNGSSGVYTPEVLEAAATAQIFHQGMLLFADHPGLTESQDRPERSIRDVAGVLTENAYWDGTALVAEAKTYEPWSSVLAQMHDAIGVSIRASARVEESDEQGRPIIAELVEGISVDFVTYPGRGGAIREVYESARPAVKVISETLPGGLIASDLRQRLSDAIASTSTDRWVEDWTDDWVVYDEMDPAVGRTVLMQQSYTSDEQGRITLTGTPQRVSRRVTYDAQNPPSSLAGVAMESTHHQKGDPIMGHIQIDEAEHKRLTEAADKVAAIESERAAAVERAEQAEAAVAEAHRQADAATADSIIANAGVEFTALEAKGLRVDMPVNESGRLDATAFEKLVKEAATEKANTSGAGRPTGFGTITESTTYSEADLDRDLGIQKGA